MRVSMRFREGGEREGERERQSGLAGSDAPSSQSEMAVYIPAVHRMRTRKRKAWVRLGDHRPKANLMREG